MTFDTLATLAGVAFLAGFFDAIAGGGGLITLPALLLTRIDPINAIATNKFQAAAATISATATYAKKGLIEWKEGKLLIPFAMAGGMSGALLVGFLEKKMVGSKRAASSDHGRSLFRIRPKIDQRDAKWESFYFSVFDHSGSLTRVL